MKEKKIKFFATLHVGTRETIGFIIVGLSMYIIYTYTYIYMCTHTHQIHSLVHLHETRVFLQVLKKLYNSRTRYVLTR